MSNPRVLIFFIIRWNLLSIMEKEMATHSSILAWEISWTEEPGGLQSKGSKRVGHDWAHIHYRNSQLWHLGSSSPTRDGTWVPCVRSTGS